MNTKFEIKDSGKREEQGTGAVRDIRTGKGRFDLIPPIPLFRLARVYEKGAVKYAERNWEKGMKFSRCMDSAIRHLIEYMLGMYDEDHLAHALFNINCIMTYEITHPELNDLPFHKEKIPALLKFLKETLGYENKKSMS